MTTLPRVLAARIQIPLISASILLTFSPLQAQQAPEPLPVKNPLTRLERFEAKKGSIIIKGFGTSAEVKGRYGSMAEITPVQMKSGDGEVLGIKVNVTRGEYVDGSAFVDYEEISELLAALRELQEATAALTDLKTFQAEYETAGRLKVAVFDNEKGERNAALEARTASGYFEMKDLPEIISAIEIAEQELRPLVQG